MTDLTLCLDSLDGLSVGDALGAHHFVPGASLDPLPDQCPWTDDTEMAVSIVEELLHHREIDQDRLAVAFARRFEPYRGYGGGAVVLLRAIREGGDWRELAPAAFGGKGSMGNGAAMRVAPLGAYYAGDSKRAALEAMRSAEITHAHPEGILGAAAVAVAAAEAGWSRLVGHRPEPFTFLESVIDYLVDSQVKDSMERALRLLGTDVAEAAYELGNGSRVLAQDTVPFALWVAATRIDDYPAAIRACVAAGGDVDTTAAIAGGVVAAYTGRAGIPAAWLSSREPLPIAP
ncbi:ADP-ribosylglycohydrolase family protein [Virgisporangium aliadipatigenens]|nr:ADP-ribosylglycohydrolase family protein [Virgisporangium aliadipatigenens]